MNTEWLTHLRRADTKTRETARTDSRSVIATGLPYALSGWLSPSDPQFDALAGDVTQETLLKWKK